MEAKASPGRPLQVILLMRRAQPGAHSVETVFGNLADQLPDDICARVVNLPYVSQGWWNRCRNLAFTARLEADVIHVTGDVTYCAMAVRRSSCALTILDLVSLDRLQGWRRRVLELLWYRFPVWWARRVTTISPAVRRDLVALIPRCEPKIEVIGCASGVQTAVGDAGGRSGLPTVLQIGTGPNKNLEIVVPALDGSGVALRIIGRLSRSQRRLLDHSGVTYSAAHDLSQDDVIVEYGRADVVTFMSTYEGFGLPIIEAQHLGVPVVTSDLEPMRWVAGNGALCVDPYDPAAVRAAITSVLSTSETRDRLIDAGRENARRFAPARVAAQYAALYRDMVGSPIVRNDRWTDGI